MSHSGDPGTVTGMEGANAREEDISLVDIGAACRAVFSSVSEISLSRAFKACA